MNQPLDDPDVRVAALVAGLINYGREYVSGLSPNAFFILNHIFVYQSRFWNWEIIFGILFVALVAISTPLNPHGQVRQYLRDFAYLFLFLCSATLVWTSFFPGVAYGTPILWDNFGLIWLGVVSVMYVGFWDWRHGVVRRLVGRVRHSNRRPARYKWPGLSEPTPAASIL